jgi:hypothetical protein
MLKISLKISIRFLVDVNNTFRQVISSKSIPRGTHATYGELSGRNPFGHLQVGA